MTSEREAQFKALVAEFPDSPMGHFSLGKLYLEEGRYALSAAALTEAVRLDAGYAAAWVALGDAHAGAGDTGAARAAWDSALKTPHGKRDMSLQADLEQRINELEG
jgi:predicted Zn-dependent protease